MDPALLAPLADELEHERLHLRQMLALLEEERAVLAGEEPWRLESLAAEKTAQVRALDLYAGRRRALLERCGVPATPAGLAACFTAAGAPGRRLAEVWREVASLAMEARDGNELNGKLIQMRLSHVQGRLASLDAAIGTERIYGADGRTRALPGSRVLGQI
jgi:flagellar biosynthesis/type III secretory pathway chaperone